MSNSIRVGITLVILALAGVFVWRRCTPPPPPPPQQVKLEVSDYGTLVGVKNAQGEDLLKGRPLLEGYTIAYQAKNAKGEWEQRSFNAMGKQVTIPPGQREAQPMAEPAKTKKLAGSITKIIATDDLIIINTFYYDAAQQAISVSRLVRPRPPNPSRAALGGPESRGQAWLKAVYAAEAPAINAGSIKVSEVGFAANSMVLEPKPEAGKTTCKQPKPVNEADESCWVCTPPGTCESSLKSCVDGVEIVACLDCLPDSNGLAITLELASQAAAEALATQLRNNGRCAQSAIISYDDRFSTSEAGGTKWLLACANCPGLPAGAGAFKMHGLQAGESLSEGLRRLRNGGCKHPITQTLWRIPEPGREITLTEEAGFLVVYRVLP